MIEARLDDYKMDLHGTLSNTIILPIRVCSSRSSLKPSQSQRIPRTPSSRRDERPSTLPRDYTFGRSKSKRCVICTITSSKKHM